MDIEEIKKFKRDTEIRITNVIEDFEKITGLQVKYLYRESVSIDSMGLTVASEVKLNCEI